MPKTQSEPSQDATGGPASNTERPGATLPRRGPPMSPNTRRQIGNSLRTVYALDPTEPPNDRIDTLVRRLAEVWPDTAAD